MSDSVHVRQNIAALLQCIEGEAPFTILDFGCGPRRDLKVFAELGHFAVGLEGAARFDELTQLPPHRLATRTAAVAGECAAPY